MRRVELKSIVDFFLGTPQPSQEEKKRLATTSFNSHGSISKPSEMSPSDDPKAAQKAADAKESNNSKMSMWRKLCFFLSLNGGVLYVLVLAFFIPCREPYCSEFKKEWTLNLTDALLTSNIETSQSAGANSVIFGYSVGDAGNLLASHRLADGAMRWNRTSAAIYRHVFCNFRVPFDADGDKRPDGLLTAFGKVAAFDPENGKLHWETETTPAGETIHKVALLGQTSVVLGLSDASLFLLDARSGRQERAVALPCSWSVDIKVAGPWKAGPRILWAIFCEYGDSLEVYTFDENELLQFNQTNDPEFKLLFSRQSDGGAIGVAGSVVSRGSSVAVSWANSVILLGSGDPAAKGLRILWQRNFTDSSGLPLPAAGIVFGHFSKNEALQIATAVRQGENSTVHILETIGGRTEASANTGSRIIMTMDKIQRRLDGAGMDTMVIESMHDGSQTNSSQPSRRTYFTMEFKPNVRVKIPGKFVYHNVATVDAVYASDLSPLTDGLSQLIVAARTPAGGTSIQRHVVASQGAETTCGQFDTKTDFTDALLLD